MLKFYLAISFILLLTHTSLANEAFLMESADIPARAVSTTNVGMGNIPELRGSMHRQATLLDRVYENTVPREFEVSQMIRRYDDRLYSRDIVTVSRYWEQLGALIKSHVSNINTGATNYSHLHDGMRAVLTQHQTLMFEGHVRIEHLLNILKEMDSTGVSQMQKNSTNYSREAVLAEIQKIKNQQASLERAFSQLNNKLPASKSVYKLLGKSDAKIPQSKKSAFRHVYADLETYRLTRGTTKGLRSTIGDAAVDTIKFVRKMSR